MSDVGSRPWAETCLERWRGGQNAEALGELLKWQRDRAYAIALRIVNRPAEAEDAVQQAFLKIFSRSAVSQFQNIDEFQAAVYRMVTQASIDLLRNGQVRSKLEKAMLQQSRSAPLPHTAALENAEALRVLDEECATLDPADRALLALCCQEGQSVALAAQSLELRRETARDRLKGLLLTLRQRLSRRGISLSLLLLIGLLQNGSSARASEAFCQTLNAQLPGAACSAITPAAQAGLSANALATQLGLGTVSVLMKMSATAALVGVAGLGYLSWSGLSVNMPAPSLAVQATPLVAPAPAPAPTPPPPTVIAAPLPPEPAKPVKAIPQEKEDEKEERVALQDLPAAVKANAEASKPGMKLLKAERENKNGAQVFTLEGVAQGVRYEITTDLNGKVLKVEEDREDERPKAQPKPQKPLPPPQNAEF
jgi:RNA polymerase sigma-70 factor (ECF subfamily)